MTKEVTNCKEVVFWNCEEDDDKIVSETSIP
jgi:hypothetical protein